MKFHCLLVCAFVLFGAQACAQHECATDNYLNHLRNQSAAWQIAEERSNEDANAYLRDHMGESRSANGLTIPVVVHIVHNGGAENISDAQVLDCINHVNDAFSNSGEYQHAEGVDSGISLCLASRDEDGEFTTGINRVQSELTDVYTPSLDLDLKTLINWDPALYLNIWVVNSITADPNQSGPVGYATLPFSHGLPTDGIVCEAAYFGSSTENSKVMVHELGHYCGLYHTFEGGCLNDDCMSDGDHVCDTPPDVVLFSADCDDGMNSCSSDEDDLSENNPFRPVANGGLGDQIDDQANYMDYSGLSCFNRFTQGQADRMCALMETHRSSLLDGLQCVSPCDNPMTLNFDVNSSELATGEQLFIENLSTGFSEASWFIDGELATSANDLDYVFLESGVYSVTCELNNGDVACFELFEIQITVSCDLDLDYSVSVESVDVDELIVAQYLGVNDFVWLVDGVASGSDNPLELSFPEAGLHAVSVQVFNEYCIEIAATTSLKIGQCGTSKHGNQWYMYSVGEVPYIFDFNSGQLEFIFDWEEASSESKTTWCDAQGIMQFTSDGESVWGADQSLLENGEGLLGSISSRNGSVIMKAPGDNELYYLFYSDGFENSFSNGVMYSTIDASGNGGLGAVIDKNVEIAFTETEGVTLAYHENLEDFWVVLYDRPNTRFLNFLVTENGISEEAVASFVEGLDPEGFGQRLVSFNPQGDLFWMEDFLFHMDKQSGEVTIAYSSFTNSTVAADFSPDGTQLYCLTPAGVERWDVSDPNNPQFTDSQSISSPLLFVDCQLAPDGNIYIIDVFQDHLMSVENANNSAGPINLNESYAEIGTVTGDFGSIFHGHLAKQEVYLDGEVEACAGQTYSYTLTGQGTNDGAIMWSANDQEIAGESNTSIDLVFDSPGMYTIGGSVQGECGLLVDELTIQVSESPSVSLPESIDACTGESALLEASGEYDALEWPDGSLGATYTTTVAGTHTVAAYNDNGCVATASTEVQFLSPLPIDLGPDTDLCDGLALVLDAGSEYSDCVWQDGSPGNTFTVADGGTYYVTATTPCFSTDTIFVDACGGAIDFILSENPFESFEIFPNPSSSFLNVQGVQLGQLVKVAMTDTRGKLVYLQSGKLSEIFPLNVTKFEVGNYMLRISNSNYSTQKKVVLMTGE